MTTATLPTPTGTTVKVFRDGPEWANDSRWFMLRSCDLRRLFVGRYELATDSDGDVINGDAQIATIAAAHPDCILVYV